MIEAHGFTPISHGAVRVLSCHRLELLLGFFVPEGVQQSYSTLERFLHVGGARRDGKGNGAQLGVGIVMLVHIVGQHIVWQDQQ